MPVTVTAGAKFGGVEFGTASGTGNGYVIGTTHIVELLRVDSQANRAHLIGFKYSHHELSDPPRGPRPPDQYVRITMLVAGASWHQRFWLADRRETVSLLLSESGDFVAWEPNIWHEWQPKGPATMVMISFRRYAT